MQNYVYSTHLAPIVGGVLGLVVLGVMDLPDPELSLFPVFSFCDTDLELRKINNFIRKKK